MSNSRTFKHLPLSYLRTKNTTNLPWHFGFFNLLLHFLLFTYQPLHGEYPHCSHLLIQSSCLWTSVLVQPMTSLLLFDSVNSLLLELPYNFSYFLCFCDHSLSPPSLQNFWFLYVTCRCAPGHFSGSSLDPVLGLTFSRVFLSASLYLNSKYAWLLTCSHFTEGPQVPLNWGLNLWLFTQSSAQPQP